MQQTGRDRQGCTRSLSCALRHWQAIPLGALRHSWPQPVERRQPLPKTPRRDQRGRVRVGSVLVLLAQPLARTRSRACEAGLALELARTRSCAWPMPALPAASHSNRSSLDLLHFGDCSSDSSSVSPSLKCRLRSAARGRFRHRIWLLPRQENLHVRLPLGFWSGWIHRRQDTGYAVTQDDPA